QVALDALPALSALEHRVRTETLSFLRTERRDRFAELRASLDPDDRTLLILRVERGLAWNDLAQAMHADDATPLCGEALKRESAGVRKGSQFLKQRLRERGRREGLPPTSATAPEQAPRSSSPGPAPPAPSSPRRPR